MVRIILAVVVALCLSQFTVVNAQEGFPNENRVYTSSIHTVLLYKEGFEMSAPVIRLNSSERLVLSFDDLREEQQEYHITIRHCRADWTTTPDMLQSEYIWGTQDEEIVQTDNSFNTTVPYIHYSIVFPTANMRPKISGNYLLIVYSTDPDKPDITWRFMVAEPSTVAVDAEITQSDRMEERFSHQQINFKVDMAGFPLSDPKREVEVVVLQNDRWDNALYAGNPRFVKGNELDYSYDEKNSFPGGNEFRGFDLKSLRTQSMRVRRIDWDGTNWQVWLLDDVNRAAKNYVTDPDINGRRLIKNDDNAVRSEIESDYAWVHFAFPFTPPAPDMKLYLFGALTNMAMGPGNEMVFNPVTKKYELDLFLKQGFYNYIYVTKQSGQTAGDAALTEGNHWETENQYMILVYLHELGGLYDRLVAVQDVNSRDRT
jgi:hypothetical protein